MKKKRKFLFSFFLLLPILISPNKLFHFYNDWIEVEYYNEYPIGFSKNHLDSISQEYLLAMVAIHECVNICPQDAPYIIESTWNRVECNWGNYGDLVGQLRSSEFRGLLDRNYYFDPSNPKHLMCLDYAKKVIKGERKIKHKRIIGWLTHYDSDTIHVNKASKRVIYTPTWHKFWTE